jgi:uncharacterized protein (TIGR00297 family)
MAERALLGAIIAALITAFARKRGSLDESGQWAAIALGVLCSVAGWPWAIILVAYFVAATLVSEKGKATKAARTQAAVPQISARNYRQVLANGALFALLAYKAKGNGAGTFGIAALGALAAASADTWATEIGTLWGGRPRSIVNWGFTGTGMSGGVTGRGTLAAVAGAIVVAMLGAWQHGFALAGTTTLAIIVGGFAGCIADSVFGATLQARRWCDHCKEWTERRVHPCSYRTVHAAGYRWITNDIVNGASTFVGAAVAVGFMRVLR